SPASRCSTASTRRSRACRCRARRASRLPPSRSCCRADLAAPTPRWSSGGDPPDAAFGRLPRGPAPLGRPGGRGGLSVVTSERERCGIDSVEIARVARLLEANDASSIARLFSPRELSDAGEGPGRAASLAARFAAKEACLKLFPRETALETIVASDFSVERDAYGAPQVFPSAAAEIVMGRHRIARIALSMTHDAASASAVAVAQRATSEAPAIGRFLWRFL